ncbi:hypothetical protein ACS0TY_010280 [Phlomoides rotata]
MSHTSVLQLHLKDKKRGYKSSNKDLRRSTWLRNWIREGDKNTSYFHRTTSGQKKGNTIWEIKDEGEIRRTKEEEIEDVFVNYFSNIFSVSDELKMEDAIEAVECKEDVTEAITQMHPSKASVPNGSMLTWYQSLPHLDMEPYSSRS